MALHQCPVFGITNAFNIQGDRSSGLGIPWETITTKPNQLTVKNETLCGFIRAAYRVEGDQISGAPDWLNFEHYDITATVDTSPTFGVSTVSLDQGEPENERMLQALLSDRFKLVAHRETK